MNSVFVVWFVCIFIFFYLFCFILAYTIKILQDIFAHKNTQTQTNRQTHTSFLTCRNFFKTLKCFVLAYTIKIFKFCTRPTQNTQAKSKSVGRF